MRFKITILYIDSSLDSVGQPHLGNDTDDHQGIQNQGDCVTDVDGRFLQVDSVTHPDEGQNSEQEPADQRMASCVFNMGKVNFGNLRQQCKSSNDANNDHRRFQLLDPFIIVWPDFFFSVCQWVGPRNIHKSGEQSFC